MYEQPAYTTALTDKAKNSAMHQTTPKQQFPSMLTTYLPVHVVHVVKFQISSGFSVCEVSKHPFRSSHLWSWLWRVHS